jgi:hypothetical protein
MKKLQIAIAICLLASGFVQDASAGHPEIDCLPATPTFDSDETPNTNKRKAGEWMRWMITAEPGSWVVFEFIAKGGARGDSPFVDGVKVFSYDQETQVELVKRGPVRPNAGGTNGEKYNYKITCYNPDGTAKPPIDPIIEVPKP